jgi:hypothetical protein
MELLMIAKLSNFEEAPVTTRNYALLPRFVLVAMRILKPAPGLLAGLAMFLSAIGVAGQSYFQNMDFEASQIPSGEIPDWSWHFSDGFGSGPPILAVYDALSLGGPMIGIIDKVTSYQSYQALQGNYSVILFAGTDGGGQPTTSTISQTGLIPDGAVSILMDVQTLHGFTVSLGDQNIDMEPFQTFASYTLYTGDISAFAGQTAQLSITAPFWPDPHGMPNPVFLDDIRFVTIPEPSVFSLFILGAFITGRRILGRFKASGGCK